MFVCVCVCVCARARVCVCLCVCLCACARAEEAKRLMDLENELYKSCSAPQGLAALDTSCE